MALFGAGGLQPEQTVREKATPNAKLKICSLNCELKSAQATVSAPKSVRFWNFPLSTSCCLQKSPSLAVLWGLEVTLC